MKIFSKNEVKSPTRWNLVGLVGNQGQTLVEAVVVLGITILLIVALVATVTIALQRSQFAKHQAQARGYSQEGMEWLRAERDKSWTDFAARVGTPPVTVIYCINDPPSWSAPPCLDFGDGNLFQRQVTLWWPSASQAMIRATMTVSWPEGGQTHQSSQVTFLTNFQK